MEFNGNLRELTPVTVIFLFFYKYKQQINFFRIQIVCRLILSCSAH